MIIWIWNHKMNWLKLSLFTENSVSIYESQNESSWKFINNFDLNWLILFMKPFWINHESFDLYHFLKFKVFIHSNYMEHTFQCESKKLVWVWNYMSKWFRIVFSFFEELFLEQSRSEETSPYKVIKQMKTNDLIRFILIYLAYHTKSGGSGEEKDLQGRKVFFWTCVL